MYKNILVATDGSKLSAKAVKHAIELGKALQSRLTAFYVSPDYPAPSYAEGALVAPMRPKEYAALCAKEAATILDQVQRAAESAGVEASVVHSIGGSPWQAILKAAGKHKCDAIVMASHGRRGVSALLLGSETQKVLTHSKLPVVVVR